jgi:hypothetical protein
VRAWKRASTMKNTPLTALLPTPPPRASLPHPSLLTCAHLHTHTDARSSQQWSSSPSPPPSSAAAAAVASPPSPRRTTGERLTLCRGADGLMEVPGLTWQEVANVNQVGNLQLQQRLLLLSCSNVTRMLLAVSYRHNVSAHSSFMWRCQIR